MSSEHEFAFANIHDSVLRQSLQGGLTLEE
jgi:hypothetical protein